MNPELLFGILMEQKLKKNKDVEKICLRDGKISESMIPSFQKTKSSKNPKIVWIKKAFGRSFYERVFQKF